MIECEKCETCGEEFEAFVHWEGDCPECGGELMPVLESDVNQTLCSDSSKRSPQSGS